jgi:hypothetical protein
MLDTSSYKHTLIYAMIMAFPLQQWLHKRASMLRSKYVTKTFKIYVEGILDVEFYFIFL